MSDIRGIRYEISKPKLNETDGYYYQRRRQVDGQGNLVGTGDELIRLSKLGSKDGQYETDLDWPKVGKLGGDSDGPIGLFSGKPMRFPFAAIFQTQTPTAAASDPNQRSALDDLIWNGRGSRPSSLDAVVAPSLVPDRYISFGNANGSTSSSGVRALSSRRCRRRRTRGGRFP